VLAIARVTTNAARINNLPLVVSQNSRDIVDDNTSAVKGGMLSNASELDKKKATNHAVR
jgi:hypothetical protein